ncbi:MAG: hypothetical protein JWL85_2 [Candidatus Saccharibacteria bacterium]|nr:hypothetical protein [Candidatus Saccharibacteria bacterium]
MQYMDTGNSQQTGSTAPQTQNPQVLPEQMFQQSQGVQSAGSQDILGQNNVRINIPVNPVDSASQARPASSGGMIWLVLLLMVVGVAIVLLVRKVRKQNSSTAPLEFTADSMTGTSEYPKTTPPKKLKKSHKKHHNLKKKHKR